MTDEVREVIRAQVIMSLLVIIRVLGDMEAIGGFRVRKCHDLTYI